MRGSAARMKWVADRAERIQSSLRDEMVWRDCRPWVETHGDLRRSLCDQGQEPCRLVEGAAGCHGQGVCDRTVLVAVMAPSTIHVSASFARPRRGLRDRGTRTRRSVFANQMFDDGIARLLKVIEQADARPSLPFLLEQTQLTSLAEPDQRVNVFGHHHESETEAVVLGSHRFEVMNHDPLASILIE